MTLLAKTVLSTTVVRGIAASAPRLARRIGRAFDRSVAARYEEQRAQVERTGFGGML
ncbi:hypothetical protein [Methylobacterium sp. J-076]|uniref:hypothetical protein n=1 Tax=Methylobacterium sp. J-076 TaxID=2836655 RepID=UPI001FB8DC8C|nr:hypothetical protein [Methylobacterium sp. J-076]MCJ2012507.1 hypothetical protein [Methylobacterium sp. J-076]